LAGERRSTQLRRRARELLVKALYQWQIGGDELPELTRQFAQSPDFVRIDQAYFHELLTAVLDDSAALDVLIARQAVRSMEELDAVGRAILLLGLAELKHRRDVPTKVVINEAVELAKRYGATDSFRFVNAVLDKSARELRASAAASPEPAQ
jgi:N utilization substance protein B